MWAKREPMLPLPRDDQQRPPPARHSSLLKAILVTMQHLHLVKKRSSGHPKPILRENCSFHSISILFLASKSVLTPNSF